MVCSNRSGAVAATSVGSQWPDPAVRLIRPEPTHPSLTTAAALKVLPLSVVSSVLTAYEGGPSGYTVTRRVDAAGYESDGGEEDGPVNAPRDDTKAFNWRFSKSPMGEWRVGCVGYTNDDRWVMGHVRGLAHPLRTRRAG